MAALLALITALLLGLTPLAAQAAMPLASLPAPEGGPYRCDGEPLVALYDNGAVDAGGIPNTSAGTVPGAVVVLQWRDQTLALPRTNNAGPPSYSDGRWWWSPVDPDHPEFRQRRGGITRYACEREP
ncbi:hypothetical protein KBY76_02950 [Synechococcus sp. GreenBA-s]|jgi:hypothetical protein|nr:hypothetical protein [Synechococcus sp. GreenBA-s]